MEKILTLVKYAMLTFALCMVAIPLGQDTTKASATDVVLYASEAPVKAGNWTVVTDSTAAGGARIANPDQGAAKIATARATPTDYFEMTFNAEAGQAYRLWIRGKAENDYWGNDSVHVQFSRSVNSSGTAIYRIGSTSGAEVNLEDCSGCGLSNWGWQDNGWGVGVMGPLIYFGTSGTQTIRIQTREDGLSIDQIVLSPGTYLNSSPGALMNDSVILPKSGGSSSTSEIVIWGSDIPASKIWGDWLKIFDGTAAGNTSVSNPNSGAPKRTSPLASPTDYFEMTFNVEAGRSYRLWIRGKAENDYWGNDSVFVQFSGSVNSSGSAIYRIGTTNAAEVNLEDCSGCGLSNWGWQDNGWGVGVLGPLVYFQATGTQTIRVQTREDGFSIDQIVLSSQTYLNSSPGSLKDDTTILPSTIGGSAPPPANQPPQVSASASPASGTYPLVVDFTANASDPDGFIASYSWTFGDGHTSISPSPSNTYMSTGSYTARVTVTDNRGASASASVVITVSAPTSGTRLKVLSWNGQFLRGTDNVYDPDRTATYIANFNPDIIAMCEIPKYPNDDVPQTFANLLAQKTGRTWYYHWVPKYSGYTEGNLILSKFPFTSTGSYYLSYQRSVARVRVRVGGKDINIFATHLDPDSSSARSTQVNQLKSYASGYAEPRILCGDFNAGPDQSEIISMTSVYGDSWQDAMDAGDATAYPDNPVQSQTRTRRGRIDYVFYRGTNLNLTNAQIPDTRDLSNTNVVIRLNTLDDLGVRPSDHNPMLATFDIR